MTDTADDQGERGGRDFVDLSAYLVDDGLSMAAGGVSAIGQPTAVTFHRYRPPAPSPLDGPGYLVITRGVNGCVPGAPVAIGRMPHGVAGGVAEWTAGRIAEADGMAAPADGEPGWYVPAGDTHCPRCGDQNWTAARLCITCTHGDDDYAGGVFAGGWSAAAGEQARAIAAADRAGGARTVPE